MSEERMPDRKRVLDTAADAVLRQRNKSYGEPDEDFQRIAKIATAMGFRFDGDPANFPDGVRDLTGSDVALFMIALKTSRLAWNPTHEDSWVDIAGYAACGLETANLQAAREEAARPRTNPAVAAAPTTCSPLCFKGHSLVGDCLYRMGQDNVIIKRDAP